MGTSAKRRKEIKKLIIHTPNFQNRALEGKRSKKWSNPNHLKNRRPVGSNRKSRRISGQTS